MKFLWRFFGVGLVFGFLPLVGQSTLPQFASLKNDPMVAHLQLPKDLNRSMPKDPKYQFIAISLAPDWAPNWQEASFQLKGKIVEWKTAGPDVLVGIQASIDQINELMNYEMAPYFDGYIFTDEPMIPNQDTTGKLWEITSGPASEALTRLVEASSLGIQVVLFQDLTFTQEHRRYLETIQNTKTGSLDIQPTIRNLDPNHAQFFFQPETGHYHLGLYVSEKSEKFVYFSLAEGLDVKTIFPANTQVVHRQLGKRTELGVPGTSNFYFFELIPANPDRNTESFEIVEKGAIDPYELVVRNQVFKDGQAQIFQSLKVNEFVTYRYQTPGGGAFEVTWEDTLIMLKDKPTERIRNNLYLGGAKWRGEKLPKLPLLEPDKVQTQPLIIDFNKTYNYRYLGEDTVDGFATWRVGFKPKVPGNYSNGTVWIDKETGAHRKIRAVQSNLDPPVVANEITAFYDWVESNGVRYWTQVKEVGLQVLNLVGERFPLQIDSIRENHEFNLSDIEDDLAQAYLSNKQILRDTPKGYRYMALKNGQRVMQESTFLKQKALLGGILINPGLDNPAPLAGFNYTNLDFLGKGYQANFFVAGVVNDIILSNPDFLGRGWDLSGELFVSALHFKKDLYRDGLEIKEESVKTLRESFNVTLGIPVTNFLRMSGNVSVAYKDYKRADDTSELFQLPSTHFENIYRLTANYDRKRFSSELQYESVKRSKWEAWGLPGNTEPLEDQFSKLRYDMSFTKPLGLFQAVRGSAGYVRGWDMDRFARSGILNGAVSGFDNDSIQATEAVRAELAYDRGISDLFQFTFRVNGARTWLDTTDINGVRTENDPVDLYGMDVSANFFGPWKTVMRLNIGYGIASDIKAIEGDLSAQILFLRLF